MFIPSSSSTSKWSSKTFNNQTTNNKLSLNHTLSSKYSQIITPGKKSFSNNNGHSYLSLASSPKFKTKKRESFQSENFIDTILIKESGVRKPRNSQSKVNSKTQQFKLDIKMFDNLFKKKNITKTVSTKKLYTNLNDNNIYQTLQKAEKFSEKLFYHEKDSIHSNNSSGIRITPNHTQSMLTKIKSCQKQNPLKYQQHSRHSCQRISNSGLSTQQKQLNFNNSAQFSNNLSNQSNPNKNVQKKRILNELLAQYQELTSKNTSHRKNSNRLILENNSKNDKKSKMMNKMTVSPVNHFQKSATPIESLSHVQEEITSSRTQIQQSCYQGQFKNQSQYPISMSSQDRSSKRTQNQKFTFSKQKGSQNLYKPQHPMYQLIREKQPKNNYNPLNLQSSQSLSPSLFQTQLKSLIQIIYLREKQISNYKHLIQKLQSDHQNKQSYAPSSRQYITPLTQQLKETTQRMLQLQKKLQQLHQIIEYLMKQRQINLKKIKQSDDKLNKTHIKHQQQLDKCKYLQNSLKHQIQYLRSLEQQPNEQLQLTVLQDKIQQMNHLIQQQSCKHQKQLQKLITQYQLKLVYSNNLFIQSQARRQQLENTAKSYNSMDLANTNSKLSILQQQMSEAKIQIIEKNDEIKRFKDEVTRLDQLVKEQNQYISQIKSQIPQNNQPKEYTRCQLPDINVSTSLIKRSLNLSIFSGPLVTINPTCSKIADFSGLVQPYKKLVGQLRLQLQQTQHSHDQQIHQLEQKLTRLSSQLQAKTKQIQTRQQFFNQCQKNSRQLLLELSKLKQQSTNQIKYFQSSIHGLNLKLKEKDGLLLTQQNKLLELEENIKLKQEQILQYSKVNEELEEKINSLIKKSLSAAKSLTTSRMHLPSLPTINNLSYIDLANSSFQSKLDQLNNNDCQINQFLLQTPKNVILNENNDAKDEQNNDLNEEQYRKYQQSLLKQLERQCAEPSHIFYGQKQQNTKHVELSQVRQSLRMTKQVNFQLFEQIGRQEKVINSLKNSCKGLFQAINGEKNEIKSTKITDELQKIQKLLLQK